MNTDASNQYSTLYRRLQLSRVVIPLLASTGVIFFEIFEHGLPFHPLGWTPIIDILVFGIIGPVLIFLVLTWLLNRVRERDEAEARLAVVTAHERELLSQLERSVRAERFGLTPTLESILAAIGAETSMTGGAIYLFREADGSLLPAAVSWPSPETGVRLKPVAQKAVTRAGAGSIMWGGDTEVATIAPQERILSIPITDHGDTLGLLLLCGPAGAPNPDPGVLGVVAGAIALLIRNNQLYARLQSQAIVDERQELAREVHDGLAQSLGFLNFKAQQVKRLLERSDLSATAVALDELCDGSREVYEEVRVLIRNLRSSAGIEGGFVTSLERYTAMVARRTGLEITLHAAAEPDLTPEVQLQLFRVVQEALNNAHRHGMARSVVIRLDDGPDCVTLSIEDDGLGLPPRGSDAGESERAGAPSDVSLAPRGEGHFGIRIMRERLQSIGGELQVESRPDEGTTVRLRVPAGCAAVASDEDGQGAEERSNTDA